MSGIQFSTYSILIVLIAVAVIGCGADSERQPGVDVSGPEPGGTVVIALPAEPDVLNPLLRTSAYAGQILSLIGGGLVQMDASLNWVPEIASDWSVAADRRSITYHLRRWWWSDEQPLSAYDVVASFDLFMSDEVASPWRGLYKEVQRAVLVDSFTVRYEFVQPSADPIARTLHSILPVHIIRHLDPAQVGSWPLNEQPLSCGPYRLERWEHNQQLVLQRNPAYPGPQPLLDRVIFRIVTDEMARTLALEVGDVDIINDVPAQAVSRLEDQQSVRLARVEGRDVGYLVWNFANPLFEDRRVRKAISLAIDRERFVTDLLNDAGTMANGLLPPGLWNHHHDLPADPYRPAEARQLLAEAGWHDADDDGIVERDGLRFSFEILTRFGDPVRENGVVIIRENLRQIGIEAVPRVMEHATSMHMTREGNFDTYLGLQAVNLYADPSYMVHSTAIDEYNVGQYANAEVDSLLAVALQMADRRQALPVWYRVQEVLAADLPMTYLYFPETIVGINQRVQNVQPRMIGAYDNLTEWWIAPGDRKYRGPGS